MDPQVDSPLAIRVDMWQQAGQQQRGGGGTKKGGAPAEGGGGSGDARERGRQGRESAWLIYLTVSHNAVCVCVCEREREMCLQR